MINCKHTNSNDGCGVKFIKSINQKHIKCKLKKKKKIYDLPHTNILINSCPFGFIYAILAIK